MSDIAADIEVGAPVPSASAGASEPARWQDYVALLKPRVMSLVVFTALTGLVSADSHVNPIIGAIAILCIAVGAGASGALNMAFDSDIDALMRRTRGRPVPMGKISRGDAFFFGGALSLFSVMLMGLAVNYLAAGLLAFTIVFYALVYTVWLKRSTPQNIVIGGLAGALPPVVGWAAATGAVPLNAWLLCAIIFLWTPPHFWALSLYTSADYAKAGVPMLPVVKGARETRKQILIYSLFLAPLGLAPLFTGLGHWIYGAVATLGGAGFLLLAARLYLSKAGDEGAAGPDGLYAAKPDTRPARDLFAFSLLYLSCLYAALLVEHGLMVAR
jgi:protoheme IX farnesyltransferase